MKKPSTSKRTDAKLELRPEYSDFPESLKPPEFKPPEPKSDADREEVLSIFRGENTLHEGRITYHKYWNFFVRVGTPSHDQDYATRQFPDYEIGSQRIFDLIADIGTHPRPPRSENEVWEKVATVWHWLSDNVVVNGQLYIDELLSPSWPSIDRIAAFYAQHGHLVWAACFSKAHLFASILGRVLPRWRLCVASAHHTGFNNQYPPTATHVFVGLYVADRWFYLDPTAVSPIPELPDFADRDSVAYPTFASVDYEHPYQVIPLPLSTLTRVPLLSP